MRFLFVSIDGLIGDIAWQVVKEGQEVRYFIESEDEREIGDGFVPKVKDWESSVDWADVIVFDDVLGQGAKAEGLRYVEITTDPENAASRRVIEANGGVLVEQFTMPDQYGGTPGLRYRVELN